MMFVRNRSRVMMMMISSMMLLSSSSSYYVADDVANVAEEVSVFDLVSLAEAELHNYLQQHGSNDDVAHFQQQLQQQHDDSRMLQTTAARMPVAAEINDCGNPFMYRAKISGRCICKEGFKGYNCTFCESNQACDTIIPALSDTLQENERITGGTCVNDTAFQYNHDIKTYDCKVDESLKAIMRGLDVHAMCDTRKGECHLALNLLNRYPVIDPFYLTCTMRECTFINNEPKVRCENINCDCSDYCSDLTKSMMGLLDTEAAVTLDVNSDGYMDVDLPNSPLPIKGQCQVASCAYDKVIKVPVVSNNNNNNDGNTTDGTIETKEIVSFGNIANFQDSNSNATTVDEEPFGRVLGMKTVSGLLLIVIYALSLLVLVTAWSSSYIIQTTSPSSNDYHHKQLIQQQQQQQQQKHYEDRIITVPEINDISNGKIEIEMNDEQENQKTMMVPQNSHNHNNINDGAAVTNNDEENNNNNNATTNNNNNNNNNNNDPYRISSFEWNSISCRIDTKHKQSSANDDRPNNNNGHDHMSDTIHSVRVNKRSGFKNILHNVSGKVTSGSVMGILGPSGSGKSSLMNALYGISSARNLVTGTVLIDGKRYRNRDRKRVCSYVHQDDCLFPTLTVRECIEYSALLRLPTTLSIAEKLDQVQTVIEELHLESVADNRIGSNYSSSSAASSSSSSSSGGGSLFGTFFGGNHKADAKPNNNNNGSAAGSRVSGGERKRVSIGMELVTSPQILFLDEPTSGLDSYTSYSILKTLKELASDGAGRIVILSIHQPNAKVFNMLDQVLLLYKGKTMYNGPTSEVAYDMHLNSGIGCPENENVADYMLDTISDVNSRETFIQSKFKMSEKELIQWISEDDITKTKSAAAEEEEEQQQQQPPTELLLSSKDDFHTETTSFFTEVPVLLQRTARNISRDRSLFIMHMTISLVLGICGGYVFYNVEDNLAGFQNRTGAFYFVLTFFGFSSFSSMDAFINERRIFVKETSAKYYSVSSYFIAKTSLDIVVLRILPITVFACLFYWIMGLQPFMGNFIIFLASVLTFNVAAGSISVCIGSFASNVGTASLLSTVIFLIMLLFGGFLVNISTLPPVIGYLKYGSIFNFAFEILITNELHDTVLSFDAPGYPTIPVYGTVFLESLNVFYTNQMVDLLALCIITILLNVATYLLLRLRVPK